MGKNIIVCCDGTGQKFEENKSNPLRFHYCLRNGESQTSFYDPGVGTFDPDGPHYGAGWLESTVAAISKTIQGGALGTGIVHNIADAYRYLMAVYRDGDKVFILGFSRGAFTAQAIAGLLHKCGLLYPHNDNLVPYALRIYLKKGNERIARDFKASMARTCMPHMIGVWDTVKSLGDDYADDFFYQDPRQNSVYGYHAVSIDEQREDFLPCLWGKKQDRNHIEVWFPGVHGDVGGGYPQDGLSNGALRWMIANAKTCGAVFDDRRVKEFKPNYRGRMHDESDGFPWFLRGTVSREIPEAANIHQSAVNRIEAKTPRYAPENMPGLYETVPT